MSEPEEQAQLAESEASGQAEEEPSWSTPQNLSIEKLDKIVIACHQVRADQKPVEYKEIVSASGIDAKTTLPNLRFLAAIGLLSHEKQSTTYGLTEKGKAYAEHLSSKELTEAGRILKELILASHLSGLTTYISVQQASGDLTYDGLFAKIKTLARVRENEQGEISGRMKSGIKCLIALLGRSGLVPQDILQSGEVSRPAVVPVSRKSVRPAKENLSEERKAELESVEHGQKEAGNTHSFQSFPFNVTITIEAKDPESIKQVRELMKELRGEKPSSETTPA